MGRKWATGGTRTSRAGVKAGLPTPGLRGQLRPSKPYPNPEISLSLGPLSPAQAVCCRSRPRRARGQKGLDTHLGPWRRRWLLHGPPPPRSGPRARRRRHRTIGGQGRDHRPSLCPARSLDSGSARSAADRPPPRAHAQCSPTSPRWRGRPAASAPYRPRPPTS